jgi:hypothetical protein
MAAELNNPIAVIERTMVGGARVARLDLEQTADLIVNLARGADSRRHPYYTPLTPELENSSDR